MVKIRMIDTEVRAYSPASPEPLLRLELGPQFAGATAVQMREAVQAALRALGQDDAVEYWGQGWAA